MTITADWLRSIGGRLCDADGMFVFNKDKAEGFRFDLPTGDAWIEVRCRGRVVPVLFFADHHASIPIRPLAGRDDLERILASVCTKGVASCPE